MANTVQRVDSITSDTDQFYCSICLEYLKSRNPRLLSCHHSFCEICLKKLVKYSHISCPKCRQRTPVIDEDVTNLPMNFHILPFLGNVKVNLVQQKKRQFFDTIKKFSDHSILKLCMKHFEVVGEICVKCSKPVCERCLKLEHQDHEEFIVGYDEGVKDIRENLEGMSSNMKMILGMMDSKFEEEEIELMKAEQMMTKYNFLQKEHETQAEKAKKMVEDISKVYYEIDKVKLERKTALENTKNLVDNLQKITKDNDERILKQYESLAAETNGHLIASMGILKPKPQVSVEDILGENNCEKLRGDPKLVACIADKPCLAMTGVVSLTASWNSLIIANYDKEQVLQINKDGYVEDVFDVDERYGKPGAVYLYHRSLYVAQGNMITQFVDIDKPTPRRKIYKTDIPNIGHIHVVSTTKIICTDKTTGRVYKYDPHEETTVMVLDGQKASYVTMMEEGDDVLYVVSKEEDHHIEMYNSKWKAVCTAGEGEGTADGCLKSPAATVCTDEGILVADTGNNRISLFDFKGRFMRHVLKDVEGLINPTGLVYQSPLLWVLCHDRIMCFNLI